MLLVCPRVQVRRGEIWKGQLWSQHHEKWWVQTCCSSPTDWNSFACDCRNTGLCAACTTLQARFTFWCPAGYFASASVHSDFSLPRLWVISWIPNRGLTALWCEMGPWDGYFFSFVFFPFLNKLQAAAVRPPQCFTSNSHTNKRMGKLKWLEPEH